MPTITGIEDRRGQVAIYLDGSVALRVRKAHFEKCPVREGDEIDPDEYASRLAAAQFADAYEAALTSLDACARSSKEIRQSLLRRGYVAPAADAVVARLTENGLIDDARYAQRMAETQARKPVGLYAFKRKLRAKGISDDDAEDALSAFDEDQQREACLLAAQKLFRKYEALPPREGRAKLSQALMRRGFAWDAIEGVLDQFFD